MSLIELENVSKVYNMGEVEVHALREVTLSMERGEYAALIGPSGSGKSTLMNMLGCLDRPTSGSYHLSGQEVTGMTRDQRAWIRNREIGFVFQNFNLLARTSAMENVELPLMYGKKLSARKRREKAAEMLQLVGLGDRHDHHPGQLSGGQQQRVAIARALATDPSILMGDEPTGNLDTRTSREIIELFRRLNEEKNLTVILVTHDLAVARSARRSVVLRDGSILIDTTDHEKASEAIQQSQALL
jgi:putative ABC transport system ATP-binding protein